MKIQMLLVLLCFVFAAPLTFAGKKDKKEKLDREKIKVLRDHLRSYATSGGGCIDARAKAGARKIIDQMNDQSFGEFTSDEKFLIIKSQTQMATAMGADTIHDRGGCVKHTNKAVEALNKVLAEPEKAKPAPSELSPAPGSDK